MSAATAELLEQITDLESLIKEQRLQGKEVSALENRLLELKEKFEVMNETLINGRSILKG